MKYRNAQYIDTTRIDCEIEHPFHGWIPYTLDPADTDMTVNNNDLLSAMAANGDVAAYVPPTQEEIAEALAQSVRAERDQRLLAVDAIAGNALRWAALSEASQSEWATYRQALLDVPQQSGFPDNITWPQEPAT